MSVTERYLRNNEAYIANGGHGALPVIPSQHVAIVACMDSRLDLFAILGLEEGEAHVMRNAGGIVTEDSLRSLVISQRLLGTREVILIHHTDCGMLKFTDDEMRDRLEAEVGRRPFYVFGAFKDLEADVRESLARVREHPFMLDTSEVHGFIFDVATGRLNEVK